VDLDHRIHRHLGQGSSDWQDVMGVLTNAANMLTWGRLEEARSLFARAQAVYQAHLEERNRLRYLYGVGIGIVPSAAVSVLAVSALRTLAPSTASAQLLALICLFAVFGSVASVLTRLSSIPLSREMSNATLFASGGSRPTVAVLFALTVHLALLANLLDVRVGAGTGRIADTAALAIAFVVGFSERLAKDIIAKIPGGSAKDDD
jgi:hypothetical protein